MAKKAASKSDRSDPRKNKSLAIRTILGKMPTAKAPEIVDAVKKEYGLVVGANLVYMLKTKGNMASDGRAKKANPGKEIPLNSAATWVDAIKIARQLLKSTGSLANAVALLSAVDG